MHAAKPFFATGGTLPPGTASYIERSADAELFDALISGTYCSVLCSRQSGKSSLMVHCMERLRARGITCAVLDISAAGTNLNVNQWYNSLLEQLGRRLGMRAEVSAFVGQAQGQSPLQKLLSCLVDVVLPAKQGPMVIFIDEIDFVRSLAFETFELFAAIRSMYNLRSVDPEANRLTFCLVGCALPADLIPDPRMTPFNIGKQLTLNDFTMQQALPLVNGLHGLPEPHRAMHRILYWTGGHPYLTQRLCEACVEKRVQRDADVDACCMELFFLPDCMRTEGNLAAVRQRLSGSSSSEREALLSLYIRTLKSKVQRADASTVVAERLKLTGVVAEEDGALRPRNRIYQRVFSLRWAQEHLPEAEQLRVKRAYRQGVLRTAAAMSALILLISTLAFYAVINAKRANRLRAAVENEAEKSKSLLYAANMLAIDHANSQNDFHTMGLLLDEFKGISHPNFELRYWRKVNHPEVYGFRASEKPLHFAQGTGIDGTVITGGADQHIRRWDVRSGKLLLDLPHPWVVHWAATSEDGSCLMSGGAESNTFCAWDIRSNPPRIIITQQNGFADDGSTGPAAYDTRQFVFRRFPPLGNLHFAFRTAGVSSDQVWVSGDGSRKAKVSREQQQEIQIVNAHTGEAMANLGSTVNIRFLCFSPNSQLLGTGGRDGKLRIWNAATGRLLHTLTGQAGAITGFSFSPDSRMIASIGSDRTCILWDVITGSKRAVLRGHESKLTDVCFSRDGNTLMTSDYNGYLKFWDAHTLDGPVQNTGNEINCMHYTRDGSRYFVGLGNGKILCYDAHTGGLLCHVNLHGGAVNDIIQGPIPGELIAALKTGWLCKLSADTGRILDKVKCSAVSLNSVTPTSEPDTFVTSDDNGELQTVTAMHVRKRNKVNTDTIDCVMSIRGGYAITGGINKVAVLDAALHQTLSLNGHEDIVYCISKSPDGKLIVTGSRDETARIWSVQTGKCLKVLTGHADPIYCAEFSPDGSRILTAGKGSVRLWDVSNGRIMLTLKPGPAVSWACFSPNGSEILVATSTGQIFRYRAD